MRSEAFHMKRAKRKAKLHIVVVPSNEHYSTIVMTSFLTFRLLTLHIKRNCCFENKKKEESQGEGCALNPFVS